MKAFSVRGRFAAPRGWQTFAKEVAADSPDGAREHVLSDLGSKHRVKRRRIEILEVQEIAASDVTDPVVRHRIGGDP